MVVLIPIMRPSVPADASVNQRDGLLDSTVHGLAQSSDGVTSEKIMPLPGDVLPWRSKLNPLSTCQHC